LPTTTTSRKRRRRWATLRRLRRQANTGPQARAVLHRYIHHGETRHSLSFLFRTGDDFLALTPPPFYLQVTVVSVLYCAATLKLIACGQGMTLLHLCVRVSAMVLGFYAGATVGIAYIFHSFASLLNADMDNMSSSPLFN
jgi:hypothetical protein